MRSCSDIQPGTKPEFPGNVRTVSVLSPVSSLGRKEWSVLEQYGFVHYERTSECEPAPSANRQVLAKEPFIQ